MPKPALEFRTVAMRYTPTQDDVLKGVSFRIEQGGYYYVRGASGAGKSTLLRLTYFGLRPTSGQILLFGENFSHATPSALPALRQQIGVVFQDFRLIEHLTARQNVALPLYVQGAQGEKTEREVRELLDWVGLADRMDALPATLSGGEQQRVAIARAIITRPRLLVADEPTGNVDDRMATRLMYLFEELNKLGTTLLVATHNDALAREFPHPEIRLEQGRLTQKAA